MERLDQTEPQHGNNLASYAVHLDGETTAHFAPDILGGIMVLDHPGIISRSSSGGALYSPSVETKAVQPVPTTVKLIPYYAWANRDPAAMQVWIPYSHA
jgi:DUF1680 family protein